MEDTSWALRNAEHWSDADVERYMRLQDVPMDRWCVHAELALYGAYDESGRLLACADDYDERNERVVRYLREHGARVFSNLSSIEPFTFGQ
jgi:hypothetical protein